MNSFKRRFLDFFAGIVAVGALGAALVAGFSYASITLSAPTLINTYQNHTFFSATTTSATSTNAVIGATSSADRVFRIAGAKKVMFYFGRGSDASANTGSSRFQVQVSPDGTNWYYFSKWLENASSTALAPVTMNTDSFTISAGTSTIVESMVNTNDTFQFARCIVIETTDGAHTCQASAEF